MAQVQLLGYVPRVVHSFAFAVEAQVLAAVAVVGVVGRRRVDLEAYSSEASVASDDPAADWVLGNFAVLLEDKKQRDSPVLERGLIRDDLAQNS